MRTLLVSPHGARHGDFFPDSLPGLVCAELRRAGHESSRLRVYYDGGNADVDAEIRRRLVETVVARGCDVLFFDRLFDLRALSAIRAGLAEVRVVLLTRGDSVSPMAGVDFVVGAAPGAAKKATRRTPTPGELSHACVALVDALAAGDAEPELPGVSRVSAESITYGPPSLSLPLPRPYEPVLEAEVLSPGAPPPVERQTVFGNVGCPYGATPEERPLYRGLELPQERPMARLGCAFCCMGGDYEARPDGEIVDEVVAQAEWFDGHGPEVRELVLEDQAPLRYLADVLLECGSRGLGAKRWLFAARSDALLRQGKLLDRAVAAARETGAELELYLTGFESFSDVELDRYNKGVRVETQLEAIERCRELRRRHAPHFDFTRARGHSLVLYNPWTRPQDLSESVETIRRHGLGELFDELGKNRLRLHEDLPIYWAARRDGALVESWEEGDEGSARRKGYNDERPWRFLDARTRLVHAVAEALRERLGAETELAQLRASVEWGLEQAPSTAVGSAVRRVMADLDALEASVGALLDAARTEPRRARQRETPVVHFWGPCNNGCESCAQGDRYMEGATLLARVEAAGRARGAVLLAGREPTLSPLFPKALARCAAVAAEAGVVSNGRRFAQPRFANACARAGLVAGSLKLFGAESGDHDARARVPGAFDQTLEGSDRLLATGRVALEWRASLWRGSVRGYAHLAELARAHGVPQLRAETSLDGLGLDRLAAGAQALARLAEGCRAQGVALEVSPLSAGETLFQRMPSRPR